MTPDGKSFAGAGRQEKPSRFGSLKLPEGIGVTVLLIAMIALASVAARGFFTYTNITNTLIFASMNAVTGFGMTFVFAMGGLDLSVGSIQGISAITAALLLSVTSTPVAIAGALASGACVGFLNGVIVSKLKVPPFVATLGTQTIVRGAALLVCKGQSVMISGHREFGAINNGKFLGIPIPLVVALVALVVLYWVFMHTPFGRHVCAVGGNQKAAIASGLHVGSIMIAGFALVGLTAGLSGVMLSSQLLIVGGSSGIGFELQTISISILGGASFDGGRGNLVGTFVASLMIATIASALNLFKVAGFYQYLYIGLLLLLALYIDTIRRNILEASIRRAK